MADDTYGSPLDTPAIQRNVSEATEKTKEFLSGGSLISKIVLVLLIIFALFLLLLLLRYIIERTMNYRSGTPWLVKGTKNAKKPLKIICDDLSHPESILVSRSTNEESGVEFTYSLWINVDDWQYNYGLWKHVFHKGNEDSWPDRAPGVWFHPKNNSLRVYMNTFNDVADHVDIGNIPLNKWFHLAIIVNSRNLDIYINGLLKKRHVLNGIPKQNYRNIYINNINTFSGFISNMRYFNYAIPFPTLEDIVNAGPSAIPAPDANETPPYLFPNWWQTKY